VRSCYDGSFSLLGSLLVSSAMAAHTDRLFNDFDFPAARVKERIAWNEKMLYGYLAGLKTRPGQNPEKPRLALAKKN